MSVPTLRDEKPVDCPKCLELADIAKLRADAEAAAKPLSLKFVRTYMRYAQKVAQENRACLARQIGVVVVKVYPDGDSNVVATGYNGPPKRTPHCDSREYLATAFWKKATVAEKEKALAHFGIDPYAHDKMLAKDFLLDQCRDAFLSKANGCGTCPRRLVGAPSGTCLELCSCEHGERNAIYNAGTDLHGCYMFCWCPTPCWDCGKAIINAGIKRVFCVHDASYGDAYELERTTFLFRHAGVGRFIAPPEFYLTD